MLAVVLGKADTRFRIPVEGGNKIGREGGKLLSHGLEQRLVLWVQGTWNYGCHYGQYLISISSVIKNNLLKILRQISFILCAHNS